MNEVSLYHGENIPQGDFSAYGHYSKLLPLWYLPYKEYY
jgi:hypothetical protein